MDIEEYTPRIALWPWLAGAVVVVGLLFGFFHWTLNSTGLKLRLVEAVQRATGRTLTISGDTHFNLSLAPAVSMEDVVLANPPGSSRPNMVTVARVEVGLALLPLLQHRLEVDHVTLVRPDVLLESNAAGRGNWLFSREGPEPAAGPAALQSAPPPVQSARAPASTQSASTPAQSAPTPVQPAPAAAETAPVAPASSAAVEAARQRLAVWLTKASVVDGRVGWLDARTGQRLEVQVPELNLDAPPGGPVTLAGAFTYEGQSIKLTGHAEPTELPDSAPGTGPWPVGLKLATGDATLTVDGQVDHPFAGRGYVLAIDAEVPDPSVFASWFPGLPLALAKSVSAQAEVSDNGSTTPTISKAQIKAASVDLGMLGGGATMQNLTIGAQGDGPIRITAGITRDGIDSGIDGFIGDLHWLKDGAAGPVTADLEWNAGSARASIKGTIEAPLQLSGYDLDVAVNVPKPLQVTNGAPPALRAVVFETRLTDAPGPVPFQFTSNAGDVTGELSVSRLAKTSGPAYSVDGQVASQRLDLDMLLARPKGPTVTPPEATSAPADSSGSGAAPAVNETPAPAEANNAPTPAPAAAGSASDKWLIPDARLPFDWLREVDANIKFGFDDVRYHGVDIRKIDSVAAINDGLLRVDPFTIAAPDQQMTGKLAADATKTPPVVHLVVNAPAVAVQALLGTLGLPEIASGIAQVQADLTGAGDSPHAIAASLNGWVGVAIEGGQLDTKMMNAWLDQVQPLHFSGPDTTPLRCFALRADLKSGIATIEPVALDTPVLIVDGTGDVNLGQETLSLQARPRATIGNTGFAVPVRLSGPIREPSAKIDISSKGLGHGLAGLLLGGKNIMGAAGGGDPCPAALAQARQPGPAEPMPGTKPAAPEGIPGVKP